MSFKNCLITLTNDSLIEKNIILLQNTRTMTEKNIHNVKASTQFKRKHKADYGKEKIEILYEDKDIIVINKPTGMLSVPYPGSKARTAQDVLEKIMRSRGTFTSGHKPFVVHRLDRDTSGVMMFALNEEVQKKIMHTWHKMVTERIYRAVAENPRNKNLYLEESGLIDDPLAQNSHHVGYVPKKDDKKIDTVPARTHFRTVLRGPTHTLFELELDTGKKNQIRAHLASRHYPLAGDENYRAQTDPFFRLALHARTLEFLHPVSGKKMKFEIPEPEEWMTYVENGDSHPRTPVWNIHTNVRKPIYEDFSPKSGPTRKSLRKMDYISQGKNKR